MYKVLFIGKGIITTSLGNCLDSKTWETRYHRREEGNLKNCDLSIYDYVVSCLPDAETATAIWDDILTSAVASKAHKTVFIEISTLTTETITRINLDFFREHLTFIEAPFTGSKTGALNGNLIYFAASQSTRPAYDVFLDSTSSKIYSFQNIGTPTQFKLFYNLWGLTSLGLMGQMLQIMNSLPQSDLVSEILTSHEGFWMNAIVRQKLHQSLSQQYEDVHCKLKYAKKDIQYAMNEFSDANLELSKCLISILEKNGTQHYDDLDFTSMCEFFR
ncbi:NAD(P)-binding domain-containing protein [Pseudomonas capsici]|uniref:NAD(P)-binding domain-containing protein n=1 Tax=Pseudomonas capsici TaxID=2810614 RepID=UPI0021F1F5A7|nr:NAD(P)-binding domain-containing protein [Pseudomonas capsici]MCV4342577.1 NAD(P)-binding domain-containing protein [Pseudomonas capsici]